MPTRKWINLDDRYPEHDQQVLAISWIPGCRPNPPEVVLFTRMPDGIGFFGDPPLIGVTHWYPVPQDPIITAKNYVQSINNQRST